MTSLRLGFLGWGTTGAGFDGSIWVDSSEKESLLEKEVEDMLDRSRLLL